VSKTPVAYTDAIADHICEEIASGRSVASICAEEGMPTKRAVFKWLYRNPEFALKYSIAHRFRADALVEETFAISDDASLDYVERLDVNGKPYVAIDKDNIARSRLMVDTRKWAAARFNRSKYGDRITHEGDAEASPIRHAIEFVIVDPLDPEPEPAKIEHRGSEET
jgi:hypothetical protein